jgi:hypothetical protein
MGDFPPDSWQTSSITENSFLFEERVFRLGGKGFSNPLKRGLSANHSHLRVRTRLALTRRQVGKHQRVTSQSSLFAETRLEGQEGQGQSHPPPFRSSNRLTSPQGAAWARRFLLDATAAFTFTEPRPAQLSTRAAHTQVQGSV